MAYTLKITGVSCSSCTASITHSLETLNSRSTKRELKFSLTPIENNTTTLKFYNEHLTAQNKAQIKQTIPYECIEITPENKNQLKKRGKSIWPSLLRLIFPLLAATALFLSLTFAFTAGLTLALSITLGLSSLLVLLLAGECFIKAFHEIRLRQPGMNSLVSTGLTIAWINSFLTLLGILTGPIAIAASMPLFILFIVNIGPFIKGIINNSISRAIRKLKQSVKEKLFHKKRITFTRLTDPNQPLGEKNEWQTLNDIKHIQKGDVIKIKKDERLPVDAVIIGKSKGHQFNASKPFGESSHKKLITKKENEAIFAGSIYLGDTPLYIRASCDGNQSSLIGNIRAAKKAMMSGKSDTITRYFFLIISIVALTAGIAWFGAAYFVLGATLNIALGYFAQVTMAVFVSACPCGLAFAKATPENFLRYIAQKAGVFTRNSNCIEMAQHIDTIIFDKTGTLTEVSINAFEVLGKSKKNNMLNIAATLEAKFFEANQEHPTARAIQRFTKRYTKDLNVNDFKCDANGVTGIIDDKTCCLGDALFLKSKDITIPEHQNKQNASPIYLSIDNEVVGIFWQYDTVRKDAKRLISKLSKKYDILMLTGGSEKSANAVAQAIGRTHFKQIHSNKNPDEKRKLIENLKKDGRKILYLGDNHNDIAAIQAADIGAVLGRTKPDVIKKADLAFLKNDLSMLQKFLKLTQKTQQNINKNYFTVLFWIFTCVAFACIHLLVSPVIVPLIVVMIMLLPYPLIALNTFALKSQLERIIHSKSSTTQSIWSSRLTPYVLQMATLSVALVLGSAIYMLTQGATIAMAFGCFVTMNFTSLCCFSLFAGYVGLALSVLLIAGLLIYYKTPLHKLFEKQNELLKKNSAPNTSTVYEKLTPDRLTRRNQTTHQQHEQTRKRSGQERGNLIQHTEWAKKRIQHIENKGNHDPTYNPQPGGCTAL